MAAQREGSPEQRRFLVINYWIGRRGDGYMDGPVLVSTCDYEQFHLWDEPGAAMLGQDEYEIVRLYPRGMNFEDAARRFIRDFAPVPDEPAESWWPLDGAGWAEPPRSTPRVCATAA